MTETCDIRRGQYAANPGCARRRRRRIPDGLRFETIDLVGHSLGTLVSHTYLTLAANALNLHRWKSDTEGATLVLLDN